MGLKFVARVSTQSNEIDYSSLPNYNNVCFDLYTKELKFNNYKFTTMTILIPLRGS